MAIVTAIVYFGQPSAAQIDLNSYTPEVSEDERRACTHSETYTPSSSLLISSHSLPLLFQLSVGLVSGICFLRSLFVLHSIIRLRDVQVQVDADMSRNILESGNSVSIVNSATVYGYISRPRLVSRSQAVIVELAEQVNTY